MSKVFQCKKCGTCCRNLWEDIRGVKKGLVITEKEVKLFPRDIVSPSVAIGMSKPDVIIFYQLNTVICPYVDDKNDCLIYSKRPLICQAFPYESEKFSTGCKVFSQMKTGQIILDSAPSRSQIDASEKLNRYMWIRFERRFRRGIKVWDYDLAKKDWLFRTQHNEYPKHMLSEFAKMPIG